MSYHTNGIVWKKKLDVKNQKIIDRKYAIFSFFEFSPFWPHFVVTACIQNVIGQKMFSQIKFRFHLPKI